MKINFFLKKLFEEYKTKNINNEEILQRCIINYCTKNIEVGFLFYCFSKNILIEMLLNINKDKSSILGFSQLITAADSELPNHDYKSNNVIAIGQENISFWDEHRSKYLLESGAYNILDSYILDMIVVDMSFKSHLVENNDYQTVISDLEEVVDAYYISKKIILYLLSKDLLLEFFLNLKLKFQATQKLSSNTVQIDDIYYAQNYIGIKFPKHVHDLMQFWYNIQNDFTNYKKDPIQYFINN